MIRSQQRRLDRARQAKKRRLSRDSAVKFERLERRELMTTDIATPLAMWTDPLPPATTARSTAPAAMTLDASNVVTPVRAAASLPNASLQSTGVPSAMPVG